MAAQQPRKRTFNNLIRANQQLTEAEETAHTLIELQQLVIQEIKLK